MNFWVVGQAVSRKTLLSCLTGKPLLWSSAVDWVAGLGFHFELVFGYFGLTGFRHGKVYGVISSWWKGKFLGGCGCACGCQRKAIELSSNRFLWEWFIFAGRVKRRLFEVNVTKGSDCHGNSMHERCHSVVYSTVHDFLSEQIGEVPRIGVRPWMFVWWFRIQVVSGDYSAWLSGLAGWKTYFVLSVLCNSSFNHGKVRSTWYYTALPTFPSPSRMWRIKHSSFPPPAHEKSLVSVLPFGLIASHHIFTRRPRNVSRASKPASAVTHTTTLL